MRKELSEDDVKIVAYKVLKEIDEICRNNNIKYSLAYGTLLGAVRHKGFIPWDDDIDIMMTRKEYKRFNYYCSHNITPFSIEEFHIDNKYNYTFSKACDKTTIVQELFGNRDNADYGIYVDIFPIDYLADSYTEAVHMFMKKEYERNMIVAYNWKRYSPSKTHSRIYEPLRWLFYIASRKINIKRKLEDVEKFYSKISKKRYAANVVDASYGIKNIMPIETFADYIDVEFEKHSFMAIKEYDRYLGGIYGDYLQLPPPEKRKTHHTFRAYWRKQ